MNAQNSFPFQFNSQACRSCGGRCCRGLGGYVWISLTELENMAAAKGMSAHLFARQYIRQVQGRLSLRELVINGEHLCCFFDLIACCCTMYENRPEQCRSFPFWDKFQGDYHGLLRECPGVTAMC
jgi:Fe-S-cluster containining protein